MENFANSYAANPVPHKKLRRLPVFFIIIWKSLLDLSGLNLSCNEASVNGSVAHILVN